MKTRLRRHPTPHLYLPQHDTSARTHYLEQEPIPIGVWRAGSVSRFAGFGGFDWFFAACLQVWVWGDIPPTSALVNLNKKVKTGEVSRARLGGR